MHSKYATGLWLPLRKMGVTSLGHCVLTRHELARPLHIEATWRKTGRKKALEALGSKALKKENRLRAFSLSELHLLLTETSRGKPVQC